jgi:hypothetical protein
MSHSRSFLCKAPPLPPLCSPYHCHCIY